MPEMALQLERSLQFTQVPADRRVSRLCGFESISQSLEARLRSDSYLKKHLSKTMTTPACQIPFDRMSGENESVNEA